MQRGFWTTRTQMWRVLALIEKLGWTAFGLDGKARMEQLGWNEFALDEPALDETY